jgi:hypothetical protein
MSNRMLLSDSISGAITIRGSKEILTYQSLNVAGVMGDMLMTDTVIWATDPIFRKTAHISVHNFIFIYSWREFRAIYPSRFGYLGSVLNNNWVDSSIVQDVSFDLSGCASESFIFRWHMSCITRQIFFRVFRCSCKFRHFILFYSLKN